ncbi:hypothetical protein BGX28_009523, partial [Mortierella sp. GBA30]
DYKHAAIDVTWGAIIGIIFAFFAYHQYYPPLTAAQCQIPYPPRDFSYSITTSDSLGTRRVDESSALENALGTQSNGDFIDEGVSPPRPLEGEEVRGRGVGGYSNYDSHMISDNNDLSFKRPGVEVSSVSADYNNDGSSGARPSQPFVSP